jgi:C4-dicarboxylate-specific signal transduction histidine kinase
MADVAASVLHNVGNVLNSVNVSSSVVREKVTHSKTASLQKVVGLLNDHAGDLHGFFTNDPKGKQLPEYLSNVVKIMTAEREETLREIATLDENIEHIKDIVASQQRYAQGPGVTETFEPADVANDALRIHAGALDASHVQIIREFTEAPSVSTDKHKVLQILVTLIGNAQQALDTVQKDDKQIVVRLGKNDGGNLKISVTDNGVGIPKENLTRIFQQSFATSKSGRHIGLHSSANSARELGGSLVAHSDGPGTGATFTLEFPVDCKKTGKPRAHEADARRE